MVYNQGLPLIVNKEILPPHINNIQVEEIKFRIYEGQWENDFKHGKGIEKFANGTLYEGNIFILLRILCQRKTIRSRKVCMAQWVVL